MVDFQKIAAVLFLLFLGSINISHTVVKADADDAPSVRSLPDEKTRTLCVIKPHIELSAYLHLYSCLYFEWFYM